MQDKTKTGVPPTYWQDVACKENVPQGEFPTGFAEEVFDVLSAKKTRREFLSILGFTIAVPTLTSCTRVPVTKALGFINRDEEVVPGVANWFATTCHGCEASCGLHVKTREGRPVKIEGNPDAFYSKGGACAVGQATVLSLYDSARLLEPSIKGKPATWAAIDSAVPAALKEANAKGKIVLLTGRVNSPSTLGVLAKFKLAYSNFEHVTYEPFSYSALFDSYGKTHGVRAIARYDLNAVESLLSVGADFLGTWYGPVAFAKAYSAQRDVKQRRGAMLRHIQVEADMSVSGSNADLRVPVSATDESAFLAEVLREVSALASRKLSIPATKLEERLKATAKTVARDLWKNRNKALVLCGSNRVDDQVNANTLNDYLGSYGKTIHLYSASEAGVSKDSEMEKLVAEMAQGKVAALLLVDVNPAYSYPSPKLWQEAAAKVGVQIYLGQEPNETSQSAAYLCPGNHFLESWNDHSLGAGRYSLTQPTIQPLRATRMYQESLLRWAGRSEGFYDFIQSTWRTNVFAKQKTHLTFDGFWNEAVRNGGVTVSSTTEIHPPFRGAPVTVAAKDTAGVDLLLYQKTGIRDGRHANNPWLQELPDPITKAAWDNYAKLSPKLAAHNGVKNGDLVTLQRGDLSLTLPVLVQAGLGENTVAVAVGYGRKHCGKAGDGVGKNVFPFVVASRGTYERTISGIKLVKASGNYEIALTQTHHVMEGRDIVRESTLEEFKSPKHAAKHATKKPPSMWPDPKEGENRWAMAINLSACTGCSACVVSCQSENNVPVVGREEVLKRREMHWLRLDRYYTGDESDPQVVHQPVLCQHCENAPCETVCPVLATVHSSDGLNQQIYNRCVGTRYCANNCPYKVRRFNWFDYNHDDPWGRMALNPDITVRSRGVMEKCSFCVQRIQEGRLKAKKEGRKVADGDFKVACQQSCPSDAIVFGDLLDPASSVSKVMEANTGYELLGELNVRPRVSFLPKVRNPL